MKSRIKVSLPLLQSRDEAEAAMRDLAIAVNSQRKICADRDAEILKINSRVEAPLAELSQTIAQLTDSLRAWAEANPGAFPKDRKSLAMTSGILGFRTGTPKLALFSRAWTWEKVISRLCSVAKIFVRTKLEVDKESILAAASDNRVSPAELATWGMKITQDESFYIEPDLTNLETRQTQQAA